MTHPTPATPSQHSEYLSKQIMIWRDHLRAEDKAARLVGLRAIRDYVDALIGQEYAAPPVKATAAQPVRPLTRLLAHVRRLL